MYKQIEHCMQQRYSGLTLHTPVHAKEYTRQFKQKNNVMILTDSKCIKVDDNLIEDNWNDGADFNGISLPMPMPNVDTEATIPKTTNQPNGAFGGARQKTSSCWDNMPKHSNFRTTNRIRRRQNKDEKQPVQYLHKGFSAFITSKKGKHV